MVNHILLFIARLRDRALWYKFFARAILAAQGIFSQENCRKLAEAPTKARGHNTATIYPQTNATVKNNHTTEFPKEKEALSMRYTVSVRRVIPRWEW